MFVHEEFLAIMFRLVNFGILIFVCVYIFKRYVLPSVFEQIREQEEQKQHIYKRHEEISIQERIVATFELEQQEKCVLLQKKIMYWYHVQKKLCEYRDQEKQKRIFALREKVTIQEKQFEYMQQKKRVVPLAIADAQKILGDSFQSEVAGRMYMAQLIDILSKEVR